MSTVITSQPLTQNSQENKIENDDDVKNTTPLTAQEDEARKKENERAVEEACCCVLDSTEDIFCLCQCFAWCFRGLGHCLDQCFEGCGDCISSSCENSDNSIPDDGCFCCDCDCSD